MRQKQLFYGGVPVPFTVSWSDEEKFLVDFCSHAQRQAICQVEARGGGKPLFGKPHSNRQRQVIALGLCDLCASPLQNRTKVSLSHARPVMHGAQGVAVLQVEPLLHRECAATSLGHCPSLRRDVEAGTLMVRQVTRWRAQFAVMDEVYVEEITGHRCQAIGHAKVELLDWIDREPGWLMKLPT